MMRVLPSGTTALLVELDSLEEVLALHATLVERRLEGIVDIVPAARTVLLVTDPAATSLSSVEAAVKRMTLRPYCRTTGNVVDIPVTYDGIDLEVVADLAGETPAEIVRRHTANEWAVAFCGFAPGFGYLVQTSGHWDVPRRRSPRKWVPAGSIALAGEFTGVYPRESPGGWQLIGRTEITVFDLSRDPAALLRPGTRVRFIDVGRA
jgi:KipI family sensor histidine kinase inhibitor